MTYDDLGILIDYNYWARDRVLDAIVRYNIGHVEYRRDPELPATERRNLNVPRNPTLQL